MTDLQGVDFLDHTADVGLRARGASLEEAFRRAALGMFSLMIDLGGIAGEIRHAVECRAETLEMLLVEWLTDLLAQKDLTGLVFGRFELAIERDEQGARLRGEARGEVLDPARHAPRLEVKGVSYLGLRVEEGANGWEVECVFDV